MDEQDVNRDDAGKSAVRELSISACNQAFEHIGVDHLAALEHDLDAVERRLAGVQALYGDTRR
ncbi:hypothetical protein LJ655_03160 [Paraburkholderia sp. MMS20-SJTN17]|uniref:Uncharacterized protein n=1 Tax=Paraburkholderia translucens TaxID=2886945 RepID=A0ABS8K846_9BURK|nr:hypothetical protein [Paraburkholderia sp. MMS20-SJTN17]MCC8400899.1 hypothetical protein [Paraburkholderia sp. MMS20-SJTN17]